MIKQSENRLRRLRELLRVLTLGVDLVRGMRASLKRRRLGVDGARRARTRAADSILRGGDGSRGAGLQRLGRCLKMGLRYLLRLAGVLLGRLQRARGG